MEWPDEVIRDVDNFLSEETVGKIMDENVVEVPERATIREVRDRIPSDKIVVVENQLDVPVGILPSGRVIELPNTLDLPLLELPEELDVPALTDPNTSLKVALENVLLSNGAINWHVVRDEDEVAGAVSSESIFQRMMGLEGVADFAQNFGSLSVAMSSLGSRLYGVRIAPAPNLHFSCSVHSPPTYNWYQVKRDAARNALCPVARCGRIVAPLP